MRPLWRPGLPSQRDLEEYDLQRRALQAPSWESGPPPEASLPPIPQQELGYPDEATLGAAPIAPGAPSQFAWELGDEYPATDPEAAVRVPALPPAPPPVTDRRQISRSVDVMAGPAMAGPAPSRVAMAAQGPAPQADLPQYDAGPTPPHPISTLLRQGGLAAANIFTAAGGRGARRATLDQQENTNRRIQEIGEQDNQQRVNASFRRNWAAKQTGQDARQARQDSQAQQDRQRRISREDKADALSAEAKDPNSRKNKIFRQAFQKEYPEAWASLTPDQQASFSIADAAALEPATRTEDRQRKLKADSASAQAAEDKEKRLIKYRQEVKRRTGGGGGGVRLNPGSDQDVLQAISSAFEGKVPPDVTARIKLANSIQNPKKRLEKLDSILRDASEDAPQQKKAAADAQQADFKETREYQNKMEGLRSAKRTALNLREALKGYTTAGQDGKLKHAGKDIPGYGRFASHLPDVTISGEGQNIRSLVRDYVSQLILARSGKAATDTERKYLESVLGVSPGMTEEQLVSALERMDSLNGEAERDLAAAYPTARQSRDENRPGATREKDPLAGGQDDSPDLPEGDPMGTPAAPGTVPMYRDGQRYDIPEAEVEEALKDGFKRRGR